MTLFWPLLLSIDDYTFLKPFSLFALLKSNILSAQKLTGMATYLINSSRPSGKSNEDQEISEFYQRYKYLVTFTTFIP